MLKDIPKDHPRYLSLLLRHKIEEGVKKGLVASAGLIAHGRGEAFDYLIGEKTPKISLQSIEAAAALLLLAKNPVLSINGNTAVLVPKEMVDLSKVISAKLEVNVFYGRTEEREKKIVAFFKKHGAKKVYGINPESKIPLLSSARARVSTEGLFSADVVLVSLEDGDRTQALINAGKKVIAIDLNPLSRTPQTASIAIVDNIVRCIPLMTKTAKKLKKKNRKELQEIVDKFDNKAYLNTILKNIKENLK